MLRAVAAKALYGERLPAVEDIVFFVTPVASLA
jgi:hypothetical protein